MRTLSNSGFSGVSQKDLKSLISKKEALEKELKRLEKKAEWERKNRLKVKEKLQDLSKLNPNDKVLKSMTRGVPGRPPIETDQPALLSTILGKWILEFIVSYLEKIISFFLEIVQPSSLADERRRSEMIRSVRTLDDLQSGLESLGFELSRATTYLRLMPRKGNTIHGKRHVKTVPVKLLR